MISKLDEIVLAFVLILMVFRLLLEVFLFAFYIFFVSYIFCIFFFLLFVFFVFTLPFICSFVCFFGVVYLGNGSRHGLWLIVSCGGGGVATDGEVRGFFISSALCSGIWMSASSKHHSCQVLIIVNEFHLLHRFPFPSADSRQRAGPTWDVGAQLIE